MKLKSLTGLLAALLLMLATSAHANQLTYTLTGPQFTTYAGPFTGTDRITGIVSFDSSYLDLTGTGSISTTSFALDPGISWSFTDGHNYFDNTITTTNFAIQMAFNSYAAFGWNIDTTFGVTAGADIFLLDSSRYESYDTGFFATSSTKATSADWVLSVPVPDTADFSILGLSFSFLGLAKIFLRKR